MRSSFYVYSIILFLCCFWSKNYEQPKLAERQKPVACYDTSKTYATTTAQLQSNFIPDSVFTITSLEKLSVTGMDCDYGDTSHCRMIRTIPPQIKNLVNLTDLSLTVNALTTLPPEMAALKKLQRVDLSDNPGLHRIDPLARLNQLEYLYLFGCNVKTFPGDLSAFGHLKELGLTGNPVEAAELTRIRKALPHCRVIY